MNHWWGRGKSSKIYWATFEARSFQFLSFYEDTFVNEVEPVEKRFTQLFGLVGGGRVLPGVLAQSPVLVPEVFYFVLELFKLCLLVEFSEDVFVLLYEEIHLRLFLISRLYLLVNCQDGDGFDIPRLVYVVLHDLCLKFNVVAQPQLQQITRHLQSPFQLDLVLLEFGIPQKLERKEELVHFLQLRMLQDHSIVSIVGGSSDRLVGIVDVDAVAQKQIRDVAVVLFVELRLSDLRHLLCQSDPIGQKLLQQGYLVFGCKRTNLLYVGLFEILCEEIVWNAYLINNLFCHCRITGLAIIGLATIDLALKKPFLQVRILRGYQTNVAEYPYNCGEKLGIHPVGVFGGGS